MFGSQLFFINFHCSTMFSASMFHGLTCLALLILLSSCFGLRVTGTWSITELFSVVAKFGFQQTDSLRPDYTQGFVFGNVTAKTEKANISRSCSDVSATFYLVLSEGPFVDELSLYSDMLPLDAACQSMMHGLSNFAFDYKCLVGGSQDFLRHVPCVRGSLCCDDDPNQVVSGFQFTYNIQDKYQPRFWYVSFVACHFGKNCTWEHQGLPLEIDYDIWLVNGSPAAKYSNPFEHQFSFEKQDTAEIFLCGAFIYLLIVLVQLHSYYNLHKSKRSLILLLALSIGFLSTICHALHTIVFSFNGTGVTVFRIVGDTLFVCSENVFILLLLLISHGWSVTDSVLPRRIFRMWWAAFGVNLIIFIWNINSTSPFDDLNLFNTSGWCSFFLRILVTFWFVLELKFSIQRRCDEKKASFLRHFGAGFLVWFIYYPILGAITTQVSALWRFKIILSISLLANTVAMAILLHLFWPKSTNSQFFLSASRLTDDLDDFERSILEDIDNDRAPLHASLRN